MRTWTVAASMPIVVTRVVKARWSRRASKVVSCGREGSVLIARAP